MQPALRYQESGHTFIVGLVLSQALLVLRVVLHVIARSAFRKRNLQYVPHGKLERVIQESWELFGSLLLLTLSTTIIALGNDGCNLLDTSGCILNWPHHTPSFTVKTIYGFMFAWFFHSSLKTWFFSGFSMGLEGFFHHLLTLTLITTSSIFNFTRIGMLLMCLFSVSSPLLHASRILKYCGEQPQRQLATKAFVGVFLLSRIGSAPLLLYCTFYHGTKIQVSSATYVAFNGLVVTLYVIQAVWAWQMVRVLRRGAPPPANAASVPEL